MQYNQMCCDAQEISKISSSGCEQSHARGTARRGPVRPGVAGEQARAGLPEGGGRASGKMHE